MRDLKNFSVAILAGGYGTRLAPAVVDKPKVLAKVSKRPFLEYLLNQLNNSHFKRAVLCTGYLSEQIEKTFGNRYKNLHLLYSTERSALGTAGSLRHALPLLTSETILVMNGDSFCDVDFKKFWKFHLNKKAKASLVLSKVVDPSHFGNVRLGVDERIIEFMEKKAGSGKRFVSAGIYLIQKVLIKKIPKSKQISIEKDIFPTWIGCGFYGYKTNDNFIDIGTPESYKRAKQFFAQYNV